MKGGGTEVGAAVVTLSVVVPLVVREVGFMEQAAPVIANGTAHAKLTEPVNPLDAASVIFEVADWPGDRFEMLVGSADSVKSGGTVTVTGAEVEPT